MLYVLLVSCDCDSCHLQRASAEYFPVWKYSIWRIRSSIHYLSFIAFDCRMRAAQGQYVGMTNVRKCTRRWSTCWLIRFGFVGRAKHWRLFRAHKKSSRNFGSIALVAESIHSMAAFVYCDVRTRFILLLFFLFVFCLSKILVVTWILELWFC